jgi:hypothetical protein
MNTERDIVLVWTTLLRALFVFWLLHSGLNYLKTGSAILCAASPAIAIKTPRGAES